MVFSYGLLPGIVEKGETINLRESKRFENWDCRLLAEVVTPFHGPDLSRFFWKSLAAWLPLAAPVNRPVSIRSGLKTRSSEDKIQQRLAERQRRRL